MERRHDTLAVVNPASAGGSTEHQWPRVRELLYRHIDFQVAFSQYPGHASELGTEARDYGVNLVVCVGGDGTVHQVVNGILSGNPNLPAPSIAVIPTGTGADYSRSLDVPRRIEEACARLANPRIATVDIGVVSFRGREGPERRYFVNAAGLGYDAEVVSRRNGFNRYVRGTIPYLASIAATLLGYRNRDIVVTAGGVRHARRVNMLVLAIGSFFGGGMRIAPEALLDDGLFDVVTIGDVGRLELVYNVPRVYSGSHLRHPKVQVQRAALVRVESEQRVLIQADGELLGRVPAEFQVFPRALTVLC